MNPAPRSRRLRAIGILVTVLWFAYVAGGAFAYVLSNRSAEIGVAYTGSALMLGWCVVVVWRQR